MDKIVHYKIDSKRSLFTVHAFADGLASTLGHSPTIAIRDYSGEVRFNAITSSEAVLQVNVKSGSLSVMDEMRDDDRRELERIMQQEVLQISRYPDVRFASSSIGINKVTEELLRVDVHGTLTIRGCTASHSFGAQVALGVDSLRAHGEFRIRQSDYGIPLVSIASGMIKVQDELKFGFYIVARKQQVLAKGA
ncbi:MAG TPA: YceI family protein [Candidatus Angelobacter sp.]|nr:YceI family protein [Candidatus Angelobacter sp.]